MPYETKYEPRQHNVICAICQAKFKSRDIQMNWQGFLVCYKDFDTRPSGLLDKLRVPTDPKPVKEIQGPETITYRTDGDAPEYLD